MAKSIIIEAFLITMVVSTILVFIIKDLIKMFREEMKLKDFMPVLLLVLVFSLLVFEFLLWHVPS